MFNAYGWNNKQNKNPIKVMHIVEILAGVKPFSKSQSFR